MAIGVLVTGFELADTTVSAFTGAIQELNDARDPRLPRLLGVACDETKTAELFELVNSSKIGVLIGPTQAASLEQVSATVNGKAVLFAPFADLPTLNSLTQTSALVSCKPQRSDLESSLSSAIGFVQSQLQDKGLVPAASRTVLDATLDEAPYLDASSAGGLATDGIGNVTMYNSHLTGKALAKALEGGSPAPALLVSLSGEVDWTANIEAVDAERAPGPFPYFLLSDTKSTALAVSNGDFQSMPDQYARVLALGYRRSAASQLVYEGVAAEFESQMARPFGPGQDYVYDCTYLAVYSALAAELRFALSPSELTPGAIISGLGALKGGKMSLSVGNISDVCAALEKGSGALSSTDLIGSSGDLDMVGPPWTDDWTVTTERAIYTHPSATDAALYCIQASEFCDTGVTFPTSGGAATKAKSTCTCLLSQ